MSSSYHVGDLQKTIQRLSVLLLETTFTRLDLLRVQIAEERQRVGAFVVRGALLCFLAFFLLQLAIVGVVAYGWDSPNRMELLWGLFGGALLATIVTWLTLQRRRTHHARQLKAIARELKPG